MDSNNNVAVAGYIVSNLELSHSVYGEKFYSFELEVSRDSGTMDYIPCLISERLLDTKENYAEVPVYVTGQFRSYNKQDDNKTHLLLYVFVNEFVPYPDSIDINEIVLDGFICKQPIYRETPLGRKITNLLIAVNRANGKSDYIPCICWGRTAYYANSLLPGAHVRLQGRIQSREYNKKIDEAEMTMIAYEMSVALLENVG